MHVGGDEIGEIGQCPRCKPIADKEGLLALNLLWLKRVCDFAREHDRIPIFWDDMLFKFAGVWDSMWQVEDESKLEELWSKGEPVLDSVLEQYPKNCVYMRWNYTLARQAGNIRALEWFKSRGLQAMIATAAQNVHPLLPQDDRVNIIQSFNRLAHEKGITFLSYPEDYIPDRYFHLASKSEDLSWMVEVDKKYHMLVRSWLDSN